MNISLPKLSIRWILPAAVVIPVFAVALALTLLAFETGKRSADDLAGQNIRQIHERIESHLDHLMDLPPAIDALNRTRLSQGILSLDDPTKSRQLLFETLDIFPDVSSVILGSATGQVTWVIRYPGETSYEYAIKSKADGEMREYTMGPDGQIGADALRTYQYTPVVRPWYHAAIDANAPTWGSVYVWVRGGKPVTLGIPYVEPYRDSQGKLLGVINCELTLSDISAFLKKLQIGKTGMAFIMERSGDLVATSIGLDCMRDGTNRVPATQASAPRIAQASRLLASCASLATIDGKSLDHAEIDGQPMQMVVSSYHNRRNLDWLIVTVAPDSDFLADVERNRTRSVFIGGAALLGAIGIGILMAMWLLKPILAVVAHARRVGSGDLDARIDRRDNLEITQLSTALNGMASGLKDRMKLRHALNLAMEVQQNLLPSRTPVVRGLDIAARSKYCDETGGDYYDYLDVEGMGPNALMVAMGDVAGHGIAAAMLMATARGVLRSQVRSQGSLGRLLTTVNQHLADDTAGDRFMTMFLAVVDVSTMSMRWASAGHDYPLIYDPQDGLIGETNFEGGGLPLGVMASEEYEESTYAKLRPGQVMLFGTDGLWEAKNDAGELFGKTRIGQAIAAMANLTAAQIEAGIYERLQEYCNHRSHDDDITYVVIKIIGSAQE